MFGVRWKEKKKQKQTAWTNMTSYRMRLFPLEWSTSISFKKIKGFE